MSGARVVRNFVHRDVLPCQGRRRLRQVSSRSEPGAPISERGLQTTLAWGLRTASGQHPGIFRIAALRAPASADPQVVPQAKLADSDHFGPRCDTIWGWADLRPKSDGEFGRSLPGALRVTGGRSRRCLQNGNDRGVHGRPEVSPTELEEGRSRLGIGRCRFRTTVRTPSSSRRCLVSKWRAIVRGLLRHRYHRRLVGGRRPLQSRFLRTRPGVGGAARAPVQA